MLKSCAPFTKFCLACCFLIGWNSYLSGQTLTGFVRDAQSQEPLVGATLYASDLTQGTATNVHGFFSLSLPQKAPLALTIRYVGYTQLDTTVVINGKEELNLYLSPADAVNLPAAEVVAKKLERGSQLSTVSIPVEQLNRIPAFLGEADPLKALSMMPGIATGQEGVSSLYVRGGTPDQNLILFDGAKVYNTNHLFGFLSPFNPDILKAVDVYKDGFPARYGGRLSSIIDITGLSGHKNEFKGQYSLGIINSRMTVQGPIKKGKLSYLLGGRFANLGLFTALFRQGYKAGRRNDYQSYLFYDFNAKVNYQSDKSSISLSYYDGKDILKMFERQSQGQRITNIDWGNRTLSLNTSTALKNGLFFNGVVAYNIYEYGIGEKIEETEEEVSSSDSESYLEELAVKLQLDIPVGGNRLAVGYEGGVTAAQPRNITISEGISTSLPSTSEEPATRVQNHSLFIEGHFAWRPWRLITGVRQAFYQVPSKVYTFFEPRVELFYDLSSSTSLRASFAKMNQPIHLLSTTASSIPSDIWLVATEDIPPQSSTQFSLGMEKAFDDSWTFAAQAFYKNSSRLIDFRRGVNFFLPGEGEIVDQVLLDGEGRAYGLELLLKKDLGKFTGWLGYTLSSSRIRFDEINGGNWYNRRYDRRHDFSATVNYEMNDRWSFAANVIFQSGFMYTLPESAHLDFSSLRTIFVYGDRNNYRAPSYQRVDVSAVKTWTSRKGKQNQLSLGVYNVFLKRNPYWLEPDFASTTEVDPITGASNIVALNPRIIQKSFLNFIPHVSFTRDL